MPHVAIAGAGLAGRLIAWRLARAGWRVSIFDRGARDDRRSASHVAAAMLSPLAERVSSDGVVFDLAQRAMALWSTWITELQQDSGHEVYHRREGTLVLAHPADRGTLEHFAQVLRQKLEPPQQELVRTVDRPGVAALEPSLAGRFEQGLHLVGDGQLANDELLAALTVALDRFRSEWHDGCEVTSLAPGALQTAEGRCDADVVVDTRGIDAKAALPGLRGVRGEVLTVECPGFELRRPVRLMHPRYQMYIAPRPRHRFVVGATELESEDRGPTTVRSVLELGSALYSLHPAFGEARLVHMAASLRPAFDDHRPVLQSTRGVWELNGLYRHGYLCAPALVDDLVQTLSR
jgi:glycine oxidase